MKSILLSAALLIATARTSTAQQLFSFADETVSVQEFMAAYEKSRSNPSLNQTKQETPQQFFESYLTYRLKIKAAQDAGLDKQPGIIAEVNSIRASVADNYLIPAATLQQYTSEAYQRSLKDIRLSHIFVSCTAGSDSAKAKEKIALIDKQLKNKADFTTTALQYSEDPDVQKNKGVIGYITVFTLPYQLESMLYSLKNGETSSPYRTAAGYHIFKRTGDRPAAGKMKIQQLLLPVFESADPDYKKSQKKLIDSVYQLVKAGGSFDEAGSRLNAGFIPASKAGEFPLVSIGEFEPVFEEKVFSLLKNGEYTAPFQTENGYHIVKRIEHFPVITNASDKENQLYIETQIRKSDRWKLIKAQIITTVKKQCTIQKYVHSSQALWDYTDSIISRKPLLTGVAVTAGSVPLAINEYKTSLQDWTDFARNNRFDVQLKKLYSYEELFALFEEEQLFTYYRNNLEKFNPVFAAQMQEYRNGMLFFEIMQQKIWTATQDEQQLNTFYQQHKEAYNWKESADAVIFYSQDKKIIDAYKNRLSAGKAQNWKEELIPLRGQVVFDSGRFEKNNLPSIATGRFPASALTNISYSDIDNMYRFSYLIHTYPSGQLKSFEEARPVILEDLQRELEKQWLAELKNKYPVTINQPEWQKLK